MTTTICPQCHYSNPADHLCCQNCGSRLPDAGGGSVGTTRHELPSPTAQQPESERQILSFPGIQETSAPFAYQGALPTPPAISSPSKSGLSLGIILLAVAALMFLGFFALVAFLLLWDGGDSSAPAFDPIPAISASDLVPFQPEPSAGEVPFDGQTVSSYTGTVTVVLPEGSEWEVLPTNSGFISLQNPYAFLDIGVYRSDLPTTPNELMEKEVKWMQGLNGWEVIVDPEEFEFENGNGVMFAMAYDIIDLVAEVGVYAMGVDSSGTVVLWVNFYGFAEDWDEFSADVEPVVQSIRSPLFE